MVELKKYAHVNKKALDQFLQFSDERDKLTNRKAEIDEAHRVCPLPLSLHPIELMFLLAHRGFNRKFG